MSYRKILDDILSVFDLSDNCKRLYLKSFEVGQQNISHLAQKLNMDRSSAYLAVEQLKHTGLIEVDETKRPMLVWTVEPRKALGRIERKIQNLEEIFDITHNSLSELEAAYKSKGHKPVLQSYSGKDGLYQIMEDILNRTDEEILLFSNQTAEKEVFTKHDHEAFIRKRKQNNINIRVITANDPFSQNLQSEDQGNLRATKILKDTQPFSCEIYIYEEKIAMLSFRNEIIGFIVNSSDFTLS
jgi:sugar-specific transcriptional regulator TrmB